MKRFLAIFFAMILLLPCLAEAEDDDDLLIEEFIEPADGSWGDVEWTFPLTLSQMNPEYIRLANKHYLLDSDYVPSDLVKVSSKPASGGIYWAVQPKGGQLLREEAAQALCDMNAVMREIDSFKAMYLKSAYRSYQTQKTMYSNRLKKNNGKDDGWVSMPGASDHQTGLGCDVVPKNWKDKSMNDKMMQEKECQWMAEHCQEYGFIIRYPADKQEITEINTEPWHLRYVGIPVATYIMENGLCLEEFTWELQAAITDFLNRGGNPDLVQDYIQTPTDESFVVPGN